MPSRKVIIPLIFTALLGGGWWFFGTPQKQIPAENKIAATDNNAWKTLSQDSDNDGLQDWEELLWKTNPKNPDTDGDGTADNDEILAKRDPRKPGPDDKMNMLHPDSADSAGALTANNEENLTAQLAQNFGTAYFSQKIASASNGNLSVEKNTLVNQMLSGIANTITKENIIDDTPKFSAKDFRLSASASEQDARTYLNTLGGIFKSASFPPKSDIEAITEAIKKQGQGLGDMKDLQMYRDGYEKLAQDLKTIPIPQPFFETHIAMANNFWRLGLYMEEFINMKTDPIKGIIALNGYSKEGIQSVELLKKIVEEINTRRFSFSEEEGGSEFNKYLNI